MGDERRLSRNDWEALLHAPLHVYAAVASVDGEPVEAQFRRLREEIEAARSLFTATSVGQGMSDALAANLDVLWDGYQAADRSVRDGLKRASKVLRRLPEPESTDIPDWLLLVAVRIAEARRTVGEEPISPAEAKTIKDVADWLDRPPPTISPG
jgi:hypothetical protein